MDSVLNDINYASKDEKQDNSAISAVTPSTEDLDVLVGDLTNEILETKKAYQLSKRDLVNQKRELSFTDELADPDVALQSSNLDQKLADHQNMHEIKIEYLKGQRTELLRDLISKTQNVDASLTAIQLKHETILEDLERQKLTATPQTLNEINWKISELNKMFLDDMKSLKRLDTSTLRKLKYEKFSVPQLQQALGSRGLQLLPTGILLTDKGHKLTYSEASCMGLLEKLLVPEKLLSEDYPKEITPSASTEIASKISTEDSEYLTDAFVKPLLLALNEITLKKPQDPIHYLSHWLFKYRYNQEITDTRRNGALDLINQKSQSNKMRLIKQEEEAIRFELERIAREACLIELNNNLS